MMSHDVKSALLQRWDVIKAPK